MQDTALVALFTGGSTAVAAALGAGWQVLGESLRSRHERQRQNEAREAERQEAHESRLRRELARTRSAVLLLAVTVRICMDIRRDQHARLNDQDLVEMLGRARDCYYEANVEIEALRALANGGEQALTAIEALISVVAEAFSHVRSASSEQGDPDQVETLIRSALREVSEAVRSV